MANIIELEVCYVLNEDYKDILEKIEKYGYTFNAHIIEEDTYYTDKQETFIKDRICLRTRKTNEDSLELTYKPKTDNSTEKYGKKEVNISLNVKDYKDIKFVINSLGYDEYVTFKKDRTIYTKVINGFEHNIMIDKIEGIGQYIELEIIANTEEEKEKLHDELDNFVRIFECDKLVEKNKPYRDIVKEYYIKNNK
ncbi:MAG: class IV adenylate cyclase [Clostridiales bacterium]|nr:class IV adenylate cyclase [Clostridiales bacterium]